MMSIEVLQYVMAAPGFWSALGYTIASAMFVGSIIYNGEFRLAMKGIVTIISYAFFLLIITSDRIAFVERTQGISNNVMAHAGEATIIITSVCYILGMILGVLVTCYARKAQKYAKLAK
jgi:uncharacterized protein YacL